MSTAHLRHRLIAPTLGLVAALLACAAAWAGSPLSTRSAPAIRLDEFSGPATLVPVPVERVLEPTSVPALHRIACAGGPSGGRSCYAMTPAP